MSQQRKKTRLKITNDNVTGANLARFAPVFACSKSEKRAFEKQISSEYGKLPIVG